MHILFLTDNFYPEVNAPASRTYEHCKEWVRQGVEVTVVTCVPNFPQGKVYKGYKNKLYQVEYIDDIKVIRVWSYISANQGFTKRILDYVSFMVSAVCVSPFVGKPNIIIGTSPQFFTVCAAYLISKIKRVPFIFELRDLWPESIKAVGVLNDSFIIRFFEKLELSLYRRAIKIISVTNSFKRVLIERGISGEKIDVITNGVDLTRFKKALPNENIIQRYGLKGKFVAGYVGTHGAAHSLETLIRAAAILQETKGGEDIDIVLLGDGSEKIKLVQQANKMNLTNLHFIDTVPKSEVARYWSILNVSIIHLKKTDLFKTVIPSKLFECMGMGIPILHGVSGESAEIVVKEGAGVVFESENPMDLVEKLISLKKDSELYGQYKSSSYRAAQNYDRTKLASKMLSLIEQTVQCKTTALE